MSSGRTIRPQCATPAAFAASITALLIVFGCTSLPPTSPSSGDGDFFHPGLLSWQATETPSGLEGSWYRDEYLRLHVSDDSVLIDGKRVTEWNFFKADSLYRINYKQNTKYYALYLQIISSEALLYVHSDSGTTESAQIDSIGVTGVWETLTNGTTWQFSVLPQYLLGNWEDSGGDIQLEVEDSLVVVNGTQWRLVAVESNHSIQRLLLSGDSTNNATFAIYFKPGIQVLLDNSNNLSTDPYGNVNGQWQMLERWYDFLELARLHDQRVNFYDYEFYSKVVVVNNETSTRDSLLERRLIEGSMTLTVLGDITGNGEGEFTFVTDFTSGSSSSPADYPVIIYHSRTNGETEVLIDSSWVGSYSGRLAGKEYTVVMENDTLWTVYPEGRVFFAPRKLHPDSRINLEMFLFPFDPPLGYFPDTTAIFGQVALPNLLPPNPEEFSVGPGAIELRNGEDYIYGGVKHSYASSSLSYIQYSLGNYDRRYWESDTTYKNPYIQEASFTASLNSTSSP